MLLHRTKLQTPVLQAVNVRMRRLRDHVGVHGRAEEVQGRP
jgi:hypothetical protein